MDEKKAQAQADKFMETGVEHVQTVRHALGNTLDREMRKFDFGPDGRNMFGNVILNGCLDFAAIAGVAAVRTLQYPENEIKKALLFTFEQMIDETLTNSKDDENGSQEEE